MKKIKRFLASMTAAILVIGAVPSMQVYASGNRIAEVSLSSLNNGNNQAGSNANKSADNSLSAINISAGSLSPAFKYSTTSYSATVGDDVTEISVDAKTSNAKATIESITGNTNLQPGNNTISIVVKAENGTTATYKIIVTKGGQSTPAETPEETPAETPTEAPEEGTGAITLNGHEYNLSPAIPADVIPADFTKTAITYNGTEVEGLQFGKGNVVLVYLTTPDTAVKNTLAVYDQASGGFYAFIKVPLGDNFIILLSPPAEPGLPQMYTQTTVELGTYGIVNAYGTQAGTGPEENPGAPADIGEFYLVYAISNQGYSGWYQYDTKENTFQRYVQSGGVSEPEGEQDTVDADIKNLQTAYDKLDEQYQSEKGFARKTIAVLIFLAAVLIVVIVNLLLKGRKNEDEWEDDFEETPKRFRKEEKEAEKPEVKKEKKEKKEKKPVEKPAEPKKELVKKAALSKPLEQEEDDFEVIDLDDL